MDLTLKQAIAGELQVDPETLTSDTLMSSISTWDSLTALTIMVLLSDAAGTPVTPDEITKIITFGDIEKIVAARTKS